MGKQKRKHRSPAEIIAEKEAQLEKLRTRQALDEAKGNPTLLPVVKELERVNSQMRESSKLLGNSPQSCNVRRQKHLLWIAEIDAAQTLAEVSQADQERAKDALQKLMAEAVQTITAGGSVDSQELEIQAAQIMAELEGSGKIAAAHVAAINARNERQAFGKDAEEASEAEAS